MIGYKGDGLKGRWASTEGESPFRRSRNEVKEV